MSMWTEMGSRASRRISYHLLQSDYTSARSLVGLSYKVYLERSRLLVKSAAVFNWDGSTCLGEMNRHKDTVGAVFFYFLA